MKRFLFLPLILSLCMIGKSCTPLEQQARNTAAALQGALVAAQAKYQPTCAANPNQNACQVINQAVAGQNALVTAIEGYCGWSAAAPPANKAATCVPVSTAAAGLQTAINNGNLFVQELKAVIQ